MRKESNWKQLAVARTVNNLYYFSRLCLLIAGVCIITHSEHENKKWHDFQEELNNEMEN